MLRKIQIGIFVGITLFCFGWIWYLWLMDNFESIMIDDFPLSLWVTPIIIGSGLSLIGISLMYELIRRKYC